MARLFSNLAAVRHGWKSGGVYLVTAVILFAAVVFLLFRGQSGGPQEATAGNPAPDSSMATESNPATSAPRPVVQNMTTPESTPAATVLPSQLVASVQTSPEPAVVAPSAVTQPAVAPAAPANPQAEATIAEALSQIQSQPGAVIEVRNKLNAVLQMQLSPQQRERVKAEMANLADKWLFGPASFPNDRLCDTYTVRSGEVLEVIGRRLKVPHEILMQINNIPRPQALQAGKALKVVKGPFHAKVCRSTFTLDLYLQDTYVRSFKVGLGRPGYETPTGLWRVQDGGKLIKPTWTDPDSGRVYKADDPDYPLGTRWIALDGIEGAAVGRTGFAIHGTKEPEQIGTAGSRGCIRMFNGEVVLMYNLLVPVYSQVEVFD
ncbi:MAG TPA: L,D-transpeptidase family protein [Sedimentisphaerales bacterium]|nr:L,D-transpeptidase family protein [Sedimentisphaerales bacterium]